MESFITLWLAHPDLLLRLGAAGLVAGVLAGMMGIGGGVVLVPALLDIYLALGTDRAVAMPSALGTSLATIIFTAQISARSHAKRQNVDRDVVRQWAPAIACGATLGAVIARHARTEILITGFCLFLLAVSIQLVTTRKERPIDPNRPPALPARPLRDIIGAIIGTTSAIMGIGGGTLSVPAMSLCGYPVKRAIGTAAALGLVIAIPGTLSYIINGWSLSGLPPASAGFVNLVGVGLIAPFSMLAAPLGVRLVHILPASIIRWIFAGFLVFTAIRLLIPVWFGA